MANKLRQFSNMPKVGSLAISMMQDNLTLIKNRQTMDEGDVTTTQTSTQFKGSIQPLQGKKLNLKPEGQRAWSWWQIHCLNSTNNIALNDAIMFQGKKYKVMEIFPYDRNGYIEYHVVEQYR